MTAPELVRRSGVRAMPALRNVSGLMVAVLVATMVAGISQLSAAERGGGSGQSSAPPPQILVPDDSQSLRDEQMRQNYQLQQQIYRDQDRPRISPQPMDVPIMRPRGQ